MNALEAKPTLVKNGKKYSVNATYCGKTADFNGQITGGYAGTKTLCETACSSASAHMCKSSDLVVSSELGLALPAVEGWYSLGAATYLSGTLGAGANFIADCGGWTTNSGATSGPIWAPSGPEYRSCDFLRPVLCCD